MSVKRSYGDVNWMQLVPKPTAEKAKSLLIRLGFQEYQGIVEFELTAVGAVALMENIQKMQKRHGWAPSKARVLTRKQMN